MHTLIVPKPIGWSHPARCSIAADEQIVLMVVDSDSDGHTLATTDELVAFVVGRGAELTEQASTSVAGLATRVFDIIGDDASTDADAVLAKGADPAGRGLAEWDIPAGRLWLVESDRGLLLVSAGAFNLGAGGPSVIAEAEQLLSTFEFIDLS